MNIDCDRRCIVAGCVATSILILNEALTPPPVKIERSSLPATRLRGLVTMFLSHPG